MKKILSLALAAMMVVSVLPVAYAADTVGVSEGTVVEVVGTKASAYEVAVPAKMNPGQTGTVSVSGNWGAAETLTVTAPDTVELVNGDRSMEVGVTFAGITKAGHDVDAVSASADVAIDAVDTSTFFGTWTGLIEYTVEFDGSVVTEPDAGDNGEDATIITFYFSQKDDASTKVEYQAEEGMTWGEWIDSNFEGAELFTVSNDGTTISYGGKYIFAYGSGSSVVSTDIIQSGTEYLYYKG